MSKEKKIAKLEAKKKELEINYIVELCDIKISHCKQTIELMKDTINNCIETKKSALKLK